MRSSILTVGTLLTAAALAVPGAAHATAVTLGQTNGHFNVEAGATNSANGAPVSYTATYFNGGSVNGQSFGQVLQDGILPNQNPYLTDAVVVNRSSQNTLTITLETTFIGNESLGNGAAVHYADIFLTAPTAGSPNTPNTNWAYAIGLGGAIGNTQDGGQQLNGGVGRGIYQLTGNNATNHYQADQYTSDDVWKNRSGYYIGGDVASWDAIHGNTPFSEFTPPTQIKSGDANVKAVGGLTVDPITQTAIGCHGLVQNLCSVSNAITFYDVTVTIHDTGNGSMLDSLFSNFDLFWGTGDCSNDPIWGNVTNLNVSTPVPGALAILTLGLAGLTGLRRRRSA